MKAYGAYTSLVSGGFTFFADYFGKRIGFDEAIANVLEFDGDRLTGTVADPIVDKSTKLARLETLAAERHLDMALTDGGRRWRQRSRHDQGRRLRRRASTPSRTSRR